MFIDSARITVKAGDGGHGLIAFRREKFVPKGGPSGGNGGRGGDVILLVDPQLGTLRDVRYHRRYRAKRGQHGGGGNKQGAVGAAVTVRVPPGTLVRDAGTRQPLADLTEPGQTYLAARGGRGGFGNAHFKSPTNQAPHEATDGAPGEQRDIDLELKVLADVGLVGFPNAGKSTLLSRLSRARPKIADYPFTTLEPNLGIVKVGDYRSFVMADIPGLIEGASRGKGLGLQFLRHVERTRLLLFLIDATLPEPVEAQLDVLRQELATYAVELLDREALVVLTKQDAWQQTPDTAALERAGHRLLAISAVTGEGLPELVQRIDAELQRSRERAPHSGADSHGLTTHAA
ncbi:MAG: GTPase ObgE [Candidatus Marinimicrobia bacterium]|nr:GTPase ObgE [Candidatus Neomarinimicrobiota bacterium]